MNEVLGYMGVLFWAFFTKQVSGISTKWIMEGKLKEIAGLVGLCSSSLVPGANNF